MDLNVALLPDAALAEAIVRLSKRLGQECGSTLVLDAEHGPLPHLTLYLTGFPEDGVEVIHGLLQRNVAHIFAPEIAVSGAAVSPQGAVLLNVEKTPALFHLHGWMIHKLNPMRMEAVPQIWEERRERYGETELRRLKAVGFPQALDAWSPHFTVGRVPRERADEAAAIAGMLRMGGKAHTIGIGTVGEHGTLTKVIGTAILRT